MLDLQDAHRMLRQIVPLARDARLQARWQMRRELGGGLLGAGGSRRRLVCTSCRESFT